MLHKTWIRLSGEVSSIVHTELHLNLTYTTPANTQNKIFLLLSPTSTAQLTHSRSLKIPGFCYSIYLSRQGTYILHSHILFFFPWVSLSRSPWLLQQWIEMPLTEHKMLRGNTRQSHTLTHPYLTLSQHSTSEINFCVKESCICSKYYVLLT